MKQVILILCLFLFCSCSSSFRDLKSSSNNKLFDTDGFHANKRRPLYNGKYINKAKKNIINSDFEEDDSDEIDTEITNPSRKNISMYKGMIRRDSKKDDADLDDEDDIVTARQKFDDHSSARSKRELENEISEIKDLLQKTRAEVSKAQCPYPAEQEKQDQANSHLRHQDAELDDEINAELKKVSTEKPKKRAAPHKKLLPDAKPGAMSHVKD